MKFIRRQILKLMNWANNYNGDEEPTRDISYDTMANTPKIRHGNDIDQDGALNFSVLSATGGKVIQLHQYDHITDRRKTKLYIITDKEDLGNELGMIITQEYLTR